MDIARPMVVAFSMAVAFAVVVASGAIAGLLISSAIAVGGWSFGRFLRMDVDLPVLLGFLGSLCCTLTLQDGLVGTISEIDCVATDKEKLEFVNVILNVIVFFGIFCPV